MQAAIAAGWLVAMVLSQLLSLAHGSCNLYNFCNGHGRCAADGSICECEEGWKEWPDCSVRSCPYGPAFVDLPDNNGTTHLPAQCSNAGICNRYTGQCECFKGFTGRACSRRTCPNDCSGHGICKIMRLMGLSANALPAGPNVFYGEDIDSAKVWDADVMVGCVCDSSWPVGIGPGEVQESEWFGADCSLHHCPSGDNPKTPVNELNCSNAVVPESNLTRGKTGNLCQVDCSNLGICDYTTGTCKCFPGYFGSNCAMYYGMVINTTTTTTSSKSDDDYDDDS